MAEVNFNYNGIDTVIQCKIEDKISTLPGKIRDSTEYLEATIKFYRQFLEETKIYSKNV